MTIDSNIRKLMKTRICLNISAIGLSAETVLRPNRVSVNT